MKIDIVELPCRPATKKTVCSHLAPIVDLLEKHGTVFDWVTGLIPDKTVGNILLSESNIDFALITDNINVPSYINLDSSRELIFCNKCWCGVKKKCPEKLTTLRFNQSRETHGVTYFICHIKIHIAGSNSIKLNNIRIHFTLSLWPQIHPSIRGIGSSFHLTRPHHSH